MRFQTIQRKRALCSVRTAFDEAITDLDTLDDESYKD